MRGHKQDAFARDLVLAFASSNIPLEKLKVRDDGGKTLLRQFLDRYIKVDGEPPSIPTPVNLRNTQLRNLMSEGMLPCYWVHFS